MRPLQAVQIAEVRYLANLLIGVNGAGTNSFVINRHFRQVEVHSEARAHGDTAGKVQRPMAPMGHAARQLEGVLRKQKNRHLL